MIITMCVVFDTSTVRWSSIARNKGESDILDEYSIGHVTDCARCHVCWASEGIVRRYHYPSHVKP